MSDQHKDSISPALFSLPLSSIFLSFCILFLFWEDPIHFLHFRPLPFSLSSSFSDINLYLSSLSPPSFIYFSYPFSECKDLILNFSHFLLQIFFLSHNHLQFWFDQYNHFFFCHQYGSINTMFYSRIFWSRL